MGDATKTCPACGEVVKQEALICKSCHYDFRSGQMTPPAAPASSSSSLLWIVIIVVVVLCGGGLLFSIVAAIAIPGLLASQRASNERNASASLKTLTTAQADFRANDRDGNLVNDFWTADVFALYGMIPVSPGEEALPRDSNSTEHIIKLLESSVAGADGLSQTERYGSVTVPASIVVGSPKAGYLYRALGREDEGGGPTTLLNDTDGEGRFYGPVHDRSRFAFAAFPETLSAGKLLFIVNADNTIWKYNLPSTYRATYEPMQGESNSSSTMSGGALDLAGPGTGTFPFNPSATGFRKMD